MRLLFAGTPEIAASVLKSLISDPETSQHEIVGVLTQPDRPAGRGQQILKSPVKQLAEEVGISVLQPLSLSAKKDPLIQPTLRELKADLMIVVAYGLILPAAVLEIPTFGCWNIHVSLLPKWRGAAPIQRAIEAGDTHSGVSLMQMDAGLDTGDILNQKTCPITLTDTAQTLHDRLAQLGFEALKETLSILSSSQQDPSLSLSRQPQNHDQATYAHKIEKAEGEIDWNEPMQAIHYKIMAFNPWPVCFSQMEETTFRFWTSIPTSLSDETDPGTLVKLDKHRLGVVAGDHKILELLSLQLPGKKVLSAREMLNGQIDQWIGKSFKKGMPLV